MTGRGHVYVIGGRNRFWRFPFDAIAAPANPPCECTEFPTAKFEQDGLLVYPIVRFWAYRSTQRALGYRFRNGRENRRPRSVVADAIRSVAQAHPSPPPPLRRPFLLKGVNVNYSPTTSANVCRIGLTWSTGRSLMEKGGLFVPCRFVLDRPGENKTGVVLRGGGENGWLK